MLLCDFGVAHQLRQAGAHGDTAMDEIVDVGIVDEQRTASMPTATDTPIVTEGDADVLGASIAETIGASELDVGGLLAYTTLALLICVNRFLRTVAADHGSFVRVEPVASTLHARKTFALCAPEETIATDGLVLAGHQLLIAKSARKLAEPFLAVHASLAHLIFAHSTQKETFAA